jgi:hypothetical protein
MRMLNSEIAQVCYEVNREYQAALSETPGPAWEDLDTEAQRHLAAAVNTHRHLTLTFQESHELWMRNMIGMGWQWGAQKDTTHKLHPCLVHWGALPQSQRIKDIIFVTLIKLLRDKD